MKLVKEHINFKRGLDPKQAMGTGVFTNLKPRMNGILVQTEVVMMGYLKYVEVAEWRDQVDENTGEVGWPYIHIVIDINEAGGGNRSFVRTRSIVRTSIKKDLEYIFKKLGIAGEVETTTNDYEYHFYPENLKESQNFKRGLDPKAAMGVGMRERIKADHHKDKFLYGEYTNDTEALVWAISTVDDSTDRNHIDENKKQYIKFLLDEGANPHWNDAEALKRSVTSLYFEIFEMVFNSSKWSPKELEWAVINIDHKKTSYPNDKDLPKMLSLIIKNI